jgi:hypothetical protein
VASASSGLVTTLGHASFEVSMGLSYYRSP